MMILTAVAKAARRQKDQGRPEALPATGNDVLGDLPDKNNVRIQALPNQQVDRLHIGTNEFSQRVQGRANALSRKHKFYKIVGYFSAQSIAQHTLTLLPYFLYNVWFPAI